MLTWEKVQSGLRISKVRRVRVGRLFPHRREDFQGKGGPFAGIATIAVSSFGRGNNHPFGWPPAQIPASATNALGSYLGCLASKRTFG